jgi:hypothetical protein
MTNPDRDVPAKNHVATTKIAYAPPTASRDIAVRPFLLFAVLLQVLT